MTGLFPDAASNAVEAGKEAAGGWIDDVKATLGAGMIRVALGALGILLIVIAGFMLANPGSKITTVVSNLAKAA